ncbi:hypothetical protein C8R45DRAFT_637896 [Mycena sanguinolenta]|nr:hypothetical protein C8R45DRAFT_637896 [Mycena sanguinolenta]
MRLTSVAVRLVYAYYIPAMLHLIAAELVDLILDEFDARADMESLILVSRAFVSPGQCRLFRSITLAMADTIIGLSNILSESPHIGAYVRDLQLRIHIPPRNIQGRLAQAIQALSEVQRITISALSGHWLAWSWNECSEDLKTAFISLFSLPTIRSLALVGCCGVPTALISHALACYEEVILQVRDIDVAKCQISFGKTRETAPLKHLVLLDSYPAATPDFHAVVEVKTASVHLQHLEITLPTRLQGRDHDGLSIVSEYAPSLQKLTVKFPYDPFHANPTISYPITRIKLPALPQLRSLDLRATIHSFASIPDPLLLLFAGLSSLTPELEFLNIDLTATITYVPDSPYPAALAADEGLMCLRLSHLQKVHFTVGFMSSDFPLYKHKARSKIQGSLPRANAAGILSLSEKIPSRPTYSHRSQFTFS